MGLSVPKAVPSAVAPSVGNDNVPVLTKPQKGPYKPMSGKSINPVVPRTIDENEPGEQVTPSQPGFGGAYGRSGQPNTGSAGAPSVPENGFLFTQGSIDSHYLSEINKVATKVNNPPTRGKWQRIQTFLNHIAQSPQNVDPNGFRIEPPQQRTSVMRNVLPPHGDGYSPETFTPKQGPMAVRFNRIIPTTGTDPYGSGVLNNDTWGAGQTAGGVGGNQYSPTPGPPETTSTASAPTGNASTMPTWG
jgi:hypothetical protein